MGISKFSVEELHESLQGTNDAQGFLFAVLLQALIQTYIKDIEVFSEKEIYSTAAIIILELIKDLPKFPLEAIALIFDIERYKKYIPEPAFKLLEECLLKSNTTAIYKLGYQEKIELLLSLVRGLFVTTNVREKINEPIQHQKELQKQKANLQKEICLFQITSAATPMESEVITKKTKEITKISSELSKRQERVTKYLGKDAEEREYWVFAGDKHRLYVKETFPRESWGTYSTLKQLAELTQALVDKGVEERRLKGMLQTAVSELSPADEFSEKVYRFRVRHSKTLSYQKRMELSKKKGVAAFQNNSMDLEKLKTSLLGMEGEYWDFFVERKIYWCSKECRDSWVIFI